jgi:hypothetical protein
MKKISGVIVLWADRMFKLVNMFSLGSLAYLCHLSLKLH